MPNPLRDSGCPDLNPPHRAGFKTSTLFLRTRCVAPGFPEIESDPEKTPCACSPADPGQPRNVRDQRDLHVQKRLQVEVCEPAQGHRMLGFTAGQLSSRNHAHHAGRNHAQAELLSTGPKHGRCDCQSCGLHRDTRRIKGIRREQPAAKFLRRLRKPFRVGCMVSSAPVFFLFQKPVRCPQACISLEEP